MPRLYAHVDIKSSPRSDMFLSIKKDSWNELNRVMPSVNVTSSNRRRPIEIDNPTMNLFKKITECSTGSGLDTTLDHKNLHSLP
ncbi:hypothetical protein BpHYR1_054414 [Brachionus plicatilis]|uniref:Uncharacterized protein n=1 Tax=Brachionus plicatilis TaxID=10195 RepID=A0A3M7PRA6_BRAPC|nr:hypothetical protein BpHYR1_054414 [Brachionus plicatilis]